MSSPIPITDSNPSLMFDFEEESAQTTPTKQIASEAGTNKGNPLVTSNEYLGPLGSPDVDPFSSPEQPMRVSLERAEPLSPRESASDEITPPMWVKISIAALLVLGGILFNQ